MEGASHLSRLDEGGREEQADQLAGHAAAERDVDACRSPALSEGEREEQVAGHEREERHRHGAQLGVRAHHIHEGEEQGEERRGEGHCAGEHPTRPARAQLLLEPGRDPVPAPGSQPGGALVEHNEADRHLLDVVVVLAAPTPAARARPTHRCRRRRRHRVSRQSRAIGLVGIDAPSHRTKCSHSATAAVRAQSTKLAGYL